MADVDYEAIGAAIAARFAGTTAPTGEDAIALCTNEPPNQLGATPALVVFPPSEADIEWGPGSTLYSTQLWPVRFYRTQGPNYGVRMAALAKWRKALLQRVVGQIQLGLHGSGGVDWAELRSINVVEAEYAATAYDCLDMVVAVRVRQQVTAAA